MVSHFAGQIGNSEHLHVLFGDEADKMRNAHVDERLYINVELTVPAAR
jgi:predicted DNA-binding protein with PD1-like motif